MDGGAVAGRSGVDCKAGVSDGATGMSGAAGARVGARAEVGAGVGAEAGVWAGVTGSSGAGAKDFLLLAAACKIALRWAPKAAFLSMERKGGSVSLGTSDAAFGASMLVAEGRGDAGGELSSLASPT